MSPTKVRYFAYGSNMLNSQMKRRLPSARPIGIAWLDNKRMVCNKRGRDGSGKANLIESVGSITWGVLYEVDQRDLPKLDAIEGGYRRITLSVRDGNDVPVRAETYVADLTTNDATAFESYKRRLIAGAREHGLPNAYVAYLEEIPSRENS